jgi:hypothetical protein
LFLLSAIGDFWYETGWLCCGVDGYLQVFTSGCGWCYVQASSAWEKVVLNDMGCVERQKTRERVGWKKRDKKAVRAMQGLPFVESTPHKTHGRNGCV